MPKKESAESLFRRLTRLFRSGPIVRRKVRTADTVIAGPGRMKSSGVMLFQKSSSPTYANITGNAYNLSERLMRYQDFQEMEYTPELASAMDIFAEETVASDEKGRVLHIFSENPKIRSILEDLFYNILNVEFNLKPWVRNLCKYGDFFLYNDVSPEYGVVNAFPIPVNEIEREENFDPNDPFAVRFRWVSLANRVLENWEVTHFRMLGNDTFLPYGSSMIEAARRIWRQLILIEDAMLVYRVVRAPERRVFYIDVGNTNASDIPALMEEQRKQLRTNQVIDRTTGRVDLRYNPMSVDEDYYIPVRGQDTGTKIDTLKGGENTATVEDVKYIQGKLFAALKIPRAYLGYDEMLSSKATLAQEDIRFSRTINTIQKTIIAELNKLAMIHLFAHGFEGEDLMDFVLKLSNPSTIAQQQKLELWRTKFEIAGSAPEGLLDKDFLRKEVMSLTEEQVRGIDKKRMKERKIDAAIDAVGEADEGGGGGGGGGGDIFGGGGGGDMGDFDDLGGDAGGDAGGATDDLGGAEEPAAGPEEELTAADEPEEKEPHIELLTSADDPDDKMPDQSLKDIRSPVPVKNQLQVSLYNRGRRRTHGASKTQMPGLAKMTGNDSESMRDPYDNNWLKSVTSNPMGERTVRSGLSNDVMSALKSMSKKFNIVPKQSSAMLTEEVDVWNAYDSQQNSNDDNNELVIDDVEGFEMNPKA